MPKKKYDPSLVRLSLLMLLFTVGFIVAVVMANRAGKQDAARSRQLTSPTR
ncbi:MAG: hypothetical protein SF187_14660 [Deltaproteobacteria bacterium]|nr:hypothetical protein [Deltaproteobacteria bacterium]